MLNTGTITVGRISYIYDTENIIEVTVAGIRDDEEPIKVPIQVGANIMENIKSYCHIGDIIGVKGRLKNHDNSLIVAADNVTFLSGAGTDQERR